MKTILNSITALLLAFSVSFTAHAGPPTGKPFEIKNEEVKRFSELLKSFGIDGVKFEGIDALAEVRPELKSSFTEITKRMSEKPEFFKQNQESVKTLVSSINASTKMASGIYRKAEKRALTLNAKAEEVLKAVEAMPGSLATVATGKNGDIARLQKVADILARVSEKNLTTESVETDVIAGNLKGTEQKPATVDDIKILIEKAMNENRTDGKKFSMRDLIEACLAAGRKGGI